MNDVVGIEERTNETGERHFGRPVLRTLSSTKRTKAWMKKNLAESRGSESTSTGTTSVVAVVIARESDDEHSERITGKLEANRIKPEGHHARYLHLVAEAGSIVLHVSNNMNEGRKDGEDSEDGEEEGETAAAKETDEISRKDAEIRRLIEERRSTPKEEKQRVKEVSKCI